MLKNFPTPPGHIDVKQNIGDTVCSSVSGVPETENLKSHATVSTTGQVKGTRKKPLDFSGGKRMREQALQTYFDDVSSMSRLNVSSEVTFLEKSKRIFVPSEDSKCLEYFGNARGPSRVRDRILGFERSVHRETAFATTAAVSVFLPSTVR
ncbi:hypothetical protein RUND412_007974 [Rhizina undulata]